MQSASARSDTYGFPLAGVCDTLVPESCTRVDCGICIAPCKSRSRRVRAYRGECCKKVRTACAGVCPSRFCRHREVLAHSAFETPPIQNIASRFVTPRAGEEHTACDTGPA